jgi:hypothetical protein
MLLKISRPLYWLTISVPILITSIFTLRYTNNFYDITLVLLSIFLIGKFLKLPLPWIILNLILPNIIYFDLMNFIPSDIFGILFITLLLLFSPTFISRIPYYPTSKKTYDLVANAVLLNLDENKNIADLGSGFGGLIFYLAKKYPQHNFIGYELGIIPYLTSLIRSTLYINVKIKYKNFFLIPLNNLDIIYAFLSPVAMLNIEKKLSEQFKNKGIFISNSFPLPNLTADKIVDGDQEKLYIYKFL